MRGSGEEAAQPKVCRQGHEKTPDNTNARGGCKACARARNAVYRSANRESLNDRNAQYRAVNRKAVSDQRARYRAANREAIVAKLCEWRAANREATSVKSAQYRAGLRSKALDAYGRQCACCGESIERFLTLDHVDGSGAEHRREVGRGDTLNKWLKRNGYPSGFQTLCVNCNSGRAVNGGGCPHVAPVKEPTARHQIYGRKLKDETVNAYGGRCKCCGEQQLTFLTVDHALGGGNEHRRRVGGSGAHTYRWLRDRGWPEGFQILCFNCNAGRHWNGGRCPHEG